MEFDEAVAELEELVSRFEHDHDERALRALELVDTIHRSALSLITAGHADHPIARALLAMYDLVPLDEFTQVEEALDDLHPVTAQHGCALELVEVAAGSVRVKVTGPPPDDPAWASELRTAVERAVGTRYPTLTQLTIEGLPTPATAVAMPARRRPPQALPGVADGGEGPGALRHAELGGQAVILVEIDGAVRAFRDACPVDGMALHGGRLSGTVIVCPWHNCAYDARSGARVDEAGLPGLEHVPVAAVRLLRATGVGP